MKNCNSEFQKNGGPNLSMSEKSDPYTFLEIAHLQLYPSPKPTLTLTSHLGENVGLGVG